MAGYEHMARRLKRLEDRELGPYHLPSLQPKDTVLWQRLLQQRDWSEPARNLFHLWYGPQDGVQTQEQTRKEEDRLLGQLTSEELQALRHVLEQEVAREDNA